MKTYMSNGIAEHSLTRNCQCLPNIMIYQIDNVFISVALRMFTIINPSFLTNAFDQIKKNNEFKRKLIKFEITEPEKTYLF